MTTALPAPLQTGRITGHVSAIIADTATDPDTDPDLVAVPGLKATFKPKPARLLAPSIKRSLLPQTIVADFDENGILTHNGVPYIDLIATDVEEVSPVGWTWTVTITAPSIPPWTFDFELPAGETKDLSELAPVSSTNGTPILRGPSPYEDWLAHGNTGTFVDFLATLEGATPTLVTGTTTEVAPGGEPSFTLTETAPGTYTVDAGLVTGAPGGSDSATATWIETGIETRPAVEAVVATAPAIANKVDKGEVVYLDSDHASLEDALAATPMGGTLEVRGSWSRTTPWIIDKPSRVRFARGGSITTTAAVTAIRITSSFVALEKPTIVGAAATAATGHGIHAQGTESARLHHITITDPDISLIGHTAVRAEHIDWLTVQGGDIRDIAYAGILGMSCADGLVEKVSIRNVTQTGYVNSYGIAVDRDESKSLADAPRTTRFTISDCLIDGVPNWEGIDTHGGTSITITRNRVYNTNVGIALVPGRLSGTAAHSPRDVIVRDNTIDSRVTDGSRSNGIQCIGAMTGGAGSTPAEWATAIIEGNTIKRHGKQATLGSEEAGGMYLRATKGAQVRGNRMIESGCSGILLGHTNTDVSLSDNTIEDSWTNSAAYAAAVILQSTHNTATISGTKYMRGSKSATNVNSRGLQSVTDPTNVVTDGGGNDWANATVLAVAGGTSTSKATFHAAKLGIGFVGVGIYNGVGTPEGAISAPIGSLFLRQDGGAGSSLYVKESGAGAAGWVAK